MKHVGRRHVSALLVFLAILAGLIAALPGLTSRVEKHERIRARIESIQMGEGRFRELVISLRHGVTTNYDEANAWHQSNQDRRALLEREVESIPGLIQPYRDYSKAVAGREVHWEDFKRHNSVVRNSLRYFQSDLPVFLRALRRHGANEIVNEQLASLNTALFLQALGAPGDRHEDIVSSLSGLHPRMSVYPESIRAEFRLLERHAGIIVERAPGLARDLAVLVHGDARAKLARLADMNRDQLLDEQEHAAWYRRGLFGGVILLLLGFTLVAGRYLDSLRRYGEQGALLKSVTDNAGVGFLAMDGEDRVIFANPQMERLLGYPPGGLMGVVLHEAGVHVDAEGHALSAEACRVAHGHGTGGVVDGLQYIRRRDGAIIPVEYHAAPLQGDDAHGVVLVLQDISRRIEEEKDLRLAGTVFSSSQQGIIVTSATGDILRVNPAYCRTTGYSAEELVGANPRLLKSGLQDKDFYSRMWAELVLHGHWQGELMNRRKSGERYIQWASIDAVRTDQGDLLYVGITSDISELVYTRERLANLAYYDTLTNLPNRVLFQDRLAQALAQAHRDKEHFALILADLDNFKTVNDTLGHDAGDDLLVEVAHRLRSAVREVDTVARIGGDEFALILMGTQGPEDAAKVASNLVSALARPYKIQGLEITGGASLGVTYWPTDGDSPEILLKNADVAMYRAKERGRNNYQFFTNDMADGVVEAMRLESGLRKAIEANELAMYYQPQLSPDGRAVSAEALMRWHSAELGWVPPSRFIPVAERSGLIAPLGDFALWHACKQCARWRELLSPDFRVAVNLSAAQFRNEGLVERVAKVLHEFNLPGSALELEITESVIMEDVARGQAVLSSLKHLGCKLAIDDFGTGYSSLAYLKRFSVDVLKIDKSFVDGLEHERDDVSVAEAIFSLARSLDLDVVAEGVETAAQIEVLRHIAGDRGYLAQGYFYSPPVPADEFEQRFPAFRQLKLVG
jgi:diguanylate cyclase (GGDEF)-like protein/PAS domain S-box-containing protein